MKDNRFAVVEINNKNGWMMWVAQFKDGGIGLVHNPLQMDTFTEEEADKIVADRKRFIEKTTPRLVEDFYVSKVKIN